MNRVLLIIIILVLIIVGWIYLRNRDEGAVNPADVTTFEECVEAGYELAGTTPEECTTPDGRTFTEEEDTAGEDTQPAEWEEGANEEDGITFEYPSELGTEYITAVDWPPVPRISEEAYSCTEAGAVDERAGETRETEINGRTYCVTTISEGAAGSVYQQYAYAREFEENTVIMTFSLREVQCANYDEDEAAVCEAEQGGFNVDELADEMMQTVEFEAA